MTKFEKIQENAFMIIGGFAFLLRVNTENEQKYIEVVNLRNLTQTMICNVYNGKDIRLADTNFSNENMYKVLLYIERNKNEILGHFKNGKVYT